MTRAELPPLAERMRPVKLSQLVGQEHLTGEGSALHLAVRSGHIPSMILWGPPGTGKTTLANCLAHETRQPFFTLSAISSGVRDVREVIEQARNSGKAILFIDEIHRFNKGQQDALLGAVEKGIITLIGATTENPSFEVNAALLSRCQVYVLKPLLPEHLLELLDRACTEDVILRHRKIEITETEALLRLSGGDARRALTLLELIVNSMPDPVHITNEVTSRVAQQKIALYDKSGEQHYDIISAFIKSIRGSDPNAAVYYLARMIEGGEDVKFIARRMLILAAEDIGNANPTALVLANAAFQAVDVIGHPEARIILSQCAIYLACSPKSNSSYTAIEKALETVRQTGDLPVPLDLRNAPTGLMKKLDYGKNYRYAHAFEGNFAFMEFMPDNVKGMVFYEPGKNAREDEMRKYLRERWKEKYGY
ncbi:MAG: replication-associated recombination protein A [Cyclobacteriaceae bacterium]|nr:replication-associated recombination protein A [Cyclobacteriaceae bacterium]